MGIPRSNHTSLFYFSVAIHLLLLSPIFIFDRTSNADEVDFEKDIWPIFESRCNQCHDGDNQEGQLRLDARSAFFEGGVSGQLFNPKNVDKSLLLTRLSGQGDLDRMPLDDDPLTKKEIELIRIWLKSGANWPESVGAKVNKKAKHWAYEKPVPPQLPQTKSSWALNPIDRFVLKRMQDKGLVPAPMAPRGKLLRRLYLDLTGAPPTLEELRNFLADETVDAYEKTVDRLLASPRFGEKWARLWLDLARYADTNGFQADQFRSVWPYRDWVINAINSDMPFDQFTIEQLAGDLLPNATVDQKIATGFHRLTTCNVEAGVDPEQNRVNQIFDRINTTGTVWFGTTFECMQCHNHKYDPFTQREYYEMFAYFNNTPLEVKNSGNDIQYEFFGPTMNLPMSAEKKEQLDATQAELTALTAQLEKLTSQKDKSFENWLTELQTQSQNTEQWIPLKVASFHSQGGAEHQILDDQSVLLKGKNPDTDLYTLTAETSLPEIDGFKIETLTHDSLPSKGPGRNAVKGRPNFVVYEVEATVLASNESIKLTSPIADFSQGNFPVKGLFDGKADTGWAISPQFGKDHWVSVLTQSPLRANGKNLKIKFTFDQHYGGGRNIGRLRISALVGKRLTNRIPADLAKLLKPKKLTNKQKNRFRQHYLSLDKDYLTLDTRIKAAQKKLTAIKPDTTLVMVEANNRETAVFKRGNFLDKGETVKPGTPAALHTRGKTESKNRLDFARWIVSRENPLTARVVVNRWWQEIFGRGIVNTSEDFGTQGDRPTHPQLLDWLALEFMNSNWSKKHVLKQIVMSNTYRQSSNFDSKKQAVDPSNSWLARGPRFRMSAETIRDNFLTASGLMANRLGGEPVFPPQPEGIWRHVGRNAPKYATSSGDDRYRRGIYVFWRRSAPYPSFVNFDAPDRASCVVNRPTTNTPLQALTLLNDEATFELTRLFAFQLNDAQGSVQDKLVNAFQACTMRAPSPSEAAFLKSFLERRIGYYQQDVEKAKQVTRAGSDMEDVAEKAAWVSLVQILFNLDETITKE